MEHAKDLLEESCGQYNEVGEWLGVVRDLGFCWVACMIAIDYRNALFHAKRYTKMVDRSHAGNLRSYNF